MAEAVRTHGGGNRKLSGWVAAAAVVWVGLVLLTLSLKELPGNGWRLIEAAVGVLAGVLAGVVVAGVLINPIKRWIEQAAGVDRRRREDFLWLDRNYAYARATHDALRHMVCLAADSLYPRSLTILRCCSEPDRGRVG